MPEVKYYPSDASAGFGDGGRASKLLCEELKEGDSARLRFVIRDLAFRPWGITANIRVHTAFGVVFGFGARVGVHLHLCRSYDPGAQMPSCWGLAFCVGDGIPGSRRRQYI